MEDLPVRRLCGGSSSFADVPESTRTQGGGAETAFPLLFPRRKDGIAYQSTLFGYLGIKPMDYDMLTGYSAWSAVVSAQQKQGSSPSSVPRGVNPDTISA